MKRLLVVFFCGLCFFSSLGQNNIDEAIQKYNSNTIDYIHVEVLNRKLKSEQDIVLLDARTKAEYDVSHLKNAVWVGYDEFDLNKVKHLSKTSEIIVYCSIGVRSEEVGEQLQQAGFLNVKNLYGGLFKWFNKGFKVYNLSAATTQKVHPYNKFWGMLLINAEKSYH